VSLIHVSAFHDISQPKYTDLGFYTSSPVCGKEAHKYENAKKFPKGFEQGCSIVNSRHQMKQVTFNNLFHLVSILLLQVFSQITIEQKSN